MRLICEKNSITFKGKSLDDPSLFPVTFYAEQRGIKIETTYNQSKKTFLIYIDGHAFYDLPY